MRKLPTILTAIYLILVVLAIIPIFTGADPLSGIFALVLTAPGSFLFSSLLSDGSVLIGLLLVVIGAAINAAIIYFLLRWLVARLAK